MALTLPSLTAVVDAYCALRAAGVPKPYSLLSFSYQDLLLSETDWKALFGGDWESKITYRGDSAKILRWHKCANFCPKIVDTHSAYRTIGFRKVTDVDLTRARGTEVIGDLNVDLPLKILSQKFQLVIDNVSQHCFNIGFAMKQIERLVCKNGCVLHVVPLTMINQGYWNISPCALIDFYTDRGYKILTHVMARLDKETGVTETIPIERDSRISVPGDNYFQIFLAQNVEGKAWQSWPTQSKFKAHPDSTIPAEHHGVVKP